MRLASSDPLPDGSCCAPVQHTVSNAVSLKLIPTVQVDPVHGPVGTKVVLFGQGFGREKTREDRILIGGKETPVAQWSDRAIVVHVPLNAESGPMVLAQRGQERIVATFTVDVPKATGITPASAPIGTLLRIHGEHFGAYSESGATPYNYTDFDTGQNRGAVDRRHGDVPRDGIAEVIGRCPVVDLEGHRPRGGARRCQS